MRAIDASMLLTALVLPLLSVTLTRAADEQLVFFGTYTQGDSQGVYVSRFQPQTGALSAPQLVAKTENPSFLALHPSGRFLYAVNEIAKFEGLNSGAVSAFRIIDDSGRLELLNQQPSGGGAPCHLVVDATGKTVLLANYGGGSVESLPIGEDGRLGAPVSFIQHTGSSVHPRQRGPHAHSINLDPANQFAVAADLGLDKLLVYRFDPERHTLTPHDPPSASVGPGSGPRHFAFHPDGTSAYVINELALTVTAFRYDSQRGVLTPIQTISTVPEELESREGFSTAEVQAHPGGRFVYGSNRGHDSIAVFTVDGATGRLTRVQVEPTGGQTPRNFGIDPSGRFLLAANQSSDDVFVFRIDPATGRLTATDTSIAVPSPVCVKFLPTR